MRNLGIVALAAVLTGCVSVQPDASPAFQPSSFPDPATVKAERDATTRTYTLCLAKGVKRLDDRKSDPGTIAHGVIAACGSELDAEVEVYSRYLQDGLQGREKVERSAREASYGSAIQLVLENRKGQLR
jgi:hypothetical protein